MLIDQTGRSRWAALNISDTTDLLGFSRRVCREWPEKEKTYTEPQSSAPTLATSLNQERLLDHLGMRWSEGQEKFTA